ncbi:MAG: metallopeptidase TldD-related protein [Candidatus Cloacimonadaceae bacterium]|nr:TldD/PmbA family protein [Candidatus Cloacimonadota bacterium]MDY0126719.1 metallopeptidase TldD-related protein [Candidatus Cloacimonadaceae bacterium]MCB5255495.1 TldD/PmbA family protein [Candidatus Cloacimonadota bacterium]MCK9178056.1 TldD/PmbA family protein [Candidatus Cloacimonadota bacterium]MCK9242007.1 TldD/PmbA family protein [Candidatus Cloacimonadota bacterium]
MDTRQLMKGIMRALQERGADKAALWLSGSSSEEFNVVYQELNLLRSVESQSLNLGVIKDQRQANTSLNQFDEQSVQAAIDELMTAVESSNADPAFDISPKQAPQVFSDGPRQMDADKIVQRLDEFTTAMKQDFPDVFFDAFLSFNLNTSYYLNSNEVDFEQRTAYYAFSTKFTAKKDGKMSSFNYISFTLADLDKPLLEVNFLRELMRQISEQTTTSPIPKNFCGDIILAPYVGASLLYTLISQHFGSSGLLTDSSRFPEHIGKKVLDEKLSLYATPTDERLADKSFITDDGYLSKAAAIIEKGVLRHYPINLYTANKVGKPRTIGQLNQMVVEAGSTTLSDMIASVKEGVLCMRASFGSPNPNGDMSGVLKNSYYIKDGKLVYPISETMMSVNLVDVFNRIKNISSETMNLGSCIFPYIQIGDADISRK